MLRHAFRLFLLFALLVPGTARAEAPALRPIEVTLADVRPEVLWYGQFNKGVRTGWARGETAIVAEAGRKLVRFSSVGETKVIITGTKGVRTAQVFQDYEVEPPFRLLHARQTVVEDGKTNVVTLTLGPDGYVAEQRTGDTVQRRKLGPLDYRLADAIGVDVWLKRGAAPGQSMTNRDLILDKLEIIDTTYTVTGRAIRKHGGQDVPVRLVTGFDPKLKITWHLEIDADARQLSSRIASGETRLETEAEARDTSYGVDAFEEFSVNRQLEPLDKLREVVIRAHGKELDRWIKSSRGQVVAHESDGRLQVRLVNQKGPILTASAEERKAALAETVDLPISEPRVVALAREAIGDTDNDFTKVFRITSFVHNYLTYSAERTGEARMLATIERRAGDCSEFARLTAGLLRAAGLPAREVTGLLYIYDFNFVAEHSGVPDGAPRFGLHAWTEVLVGGQWWELDATANLILPWGTYIRLGAGEDGAYVWTNIEAEGGMRLEVVSVEHEP